MGQSTEVDRSGIYFTSSGKAAFTSLIVIFGLGYVGIISKGEYDELFKMTLSVGMVFAILLVPLFLAGKVFGSNKVFNKTFASLTAILWIIFGILVIVTLFTRVYDRDYINLEIQSFLSKEEELHSVVSNLHFKNYDEQKVTMHMDTLHNLQRKKYKLIMQQTNSFDELSKVVFYDLRNEVKIFTSQIDPIGKSLYPNKNSGLFDHCNTQEKLQVVIDRITMIDHLNTTSINLIENYQKDFEVRLLDLGLSQNEVDYQKTNLFDEQMNSALDLVTGLLELDHKITMELLSLARKLNLDWKKWRYDNSSNILIFDDKLLQMIYIGSLRQVDSFHRDKDDLQLIYDKENGS
ncbi:hypothetical protein KS4_17340 [Poriferisphaera corsica]|uniref:Uncharacterized protein n=1 Tax=Poriferisphaera corsica TaxID=2528020 RepID=A0A517YTX7_9BACT|nr:hypothetical protein [Poriferisphaera corsica]QDU33678.1 hypothetical protein KS4_17340 [Poriferisphaera corsica]